MKKIFESFQDYYEEKINEVAKVGDISDKDWQRMLDLLLNKNDGEKVAKKIKNKVKAINRFVAGVKLAGKQLEYEKILHSYTCIFREFGNKAIELGATQEEIKFAFDNIIVPKKWIKEYDKLKTKQISGFAGPISKIVLKNYCDIEYAKYNGRAITSDGKEAMQRNGRKWTIGYKAIITVNSEKMDFGFDAITDEGGGSTKYVLSINDTDERITSNWNVDIAGVKAFTKELENVLIKLKK